MKVTQEKLPASQIGLEIEITPEMSKNAYEKAVRDFMRNVNIPGFRRGKVPRQVLIQRLGANRIKASVLEDLIEDSLKQAIDQEKIEAIGNFQLRSSFDELVQQFEPGSELTFSAAVDVPPVPNLKQHKDLTVQAEEVKYDPARVDEVLENYRERSATLVPVEGRPAQETDLAVVDFEGRFTEAPEDASSDGESEEDALAIPGGSATDFQIELTEGRFIPGFVEGIIGMSPGETREVNVTFPEDYAQEDLAGKAAVFTITLKELKEKELPELDDDFAQDVSEFETLEELRASLEERFQKEAEEATRTNQEVALLKELVAQLEIEIPETLIGQEVNNVVTQSVMQLARQGLDVKSMLTEDIVKQLRERARPEAITRLQRTFALGKVAELESIKVEEAQVNEKVNEILQDYSSEDLDLDQLKQNVEEDLLKQNIFDWLLENCTVELVPEGTLQPEESESAAATEETASPDGADTEQTASPDPTPVATATPEVDPGTATLEAEATEVESEVESQVAEAPATTVPAEEPIPDPEPTAKTTAKSTRGKKKPKEAEASPDTPEHTEEGAETATKAKSTRKKSSTTGKTKAKSSSKSTEEMVEADAPTAAAEEEADKPAKTSKTTAKKRSKTKSSDAE
jgi:trigger factor